MMGDIMSERWAASFRNGGRHQIGIVGGFARNRIAEPEDAKAFAKRFGGKRLPTQRVLTTGLDNGGGVRIPKRKSGAGSLAGLGRVRRVDAKPPVAAVLELSIMST
jgi:hypothetical protein